MAELRSRCRQEDRTFSRSDLHQAIMLGAVERVRPKMMTVVAIIAGLVPILWSTGTGSEVMQRIASAHDWGHDITRVPAVSGG
jgi:Cu(I)/Ag(I) efflux system membrane protein CusA/SilA